MLIPTVLLVDDSTADLRLLILAAGENRSVWIRIASRTAIYLTPVLWNPF